MTGKRSIGGFSTGDSGVVSHDSLLDRCRDGSYTRSERSLSPPDSSMLSSRPSVGEFDAVNRASILDSRYRSRSKSRYFHSAIVVACCALFLSTERNLHGFGWLLCLTLCCILIVYFVAVGFLSVRLTLSLDSIVDDKVWSRCAGAVFVVIHIHG